MTADKKQAELLETFVSEDRHVDEIYGMEWGTPFQWPNIRLMLHHWMIPAVRTHRRIVEIGVGGGRWLQVYLAGIDHAYLVDGTPAAETAVRQWFEGPLDFIVSPDGSLPEIPDASEPYVFSFDVFVHFDSPLFENYVREIGRILTSGGVFHFNFANQVCADTEHDGQCFLYREADDVRELLRQNGMIPTDRSI